MRFPQYRQGKTYVWRQTHGSFPQKTTRRGALGYFEGSDKVHLYLTVIMDLPHPHDAFALLQKKKEYMEKEDEEHQRTLAERSARVEAAQDSRVVVDEGGSLVIIWRIS